MKTKAVFVACMIGLLAGVAAAQKESGYVFPNDAVSKSGTNDYDTLLAMGATSTNGPNQTGCVFTNNDEFPGANDISKFGANDDGTLVAMGVTPTGGSGVGGGFFGNTRLVQTPDGVCLFAANPGSNNISLFVIDALGCDLSPAGPPISSGGVAGSLGMALSIDPANNRLYAVNPTSNNIGRFDINGDCTLTSLGTTPGYFGFGSADDAVVDPSGSFFYVVYFDGNRVGSWTIDAPTGDLTPTPGCNPCSPALGPGNIAGFDINAGGDLLFAGQAQFPGTVVNVFDVSTGVAANIPGSPFSFTSGSNSNIVKLGDGCLLATNQQSNTLSRMNVDPGGPLSLAGPAVPVPGGDFPTGMAFGCLNGDGNYPLWVTKWNPSAVAAFLWNADGCATVSNAGVFPSGVSGPHLLRGIVFVPNDPKSCILPSTDTGTP